MGKPSMSKGLPRLKIHCMQCTVQIIAAVHNAHADATDRNRVADSFMIQSMPALFFPTSVFVNTRNTRFAGS